MFSVGWEKFLKKVSNDDSPSRRRRYERRGQDVCIIELNGQNYPVKDWSMGGVLIDSEDKTLSLHDMIDFKIKFKLKDRLIEVPHSRQVVRKSKTQIGLRFDPLSLDMRTEFDRVIEDGR